MMGKLGVVSRLVFDIIKSNCQTAIFVTIARFVCHCLAFDSKASYPQFVTKKELLIAEAEELQAESRMLHHGHACSSREWSIQIEDTWGRVSRLR